MNDLKRVFLIFILSLLLAACKVEIVTRDGAEVSISPANPGLSPAPTSTSTLVSTALPTKTSTATAPTTTRPPAPTATRFPVPTATPRPPQIFSVQVWPSEADPGDVVTLTWQARGDRATICPSSDRYVLFTPDDCRPVPVSGTMTFTIPQEATASHGLIRFTLSVETDDAPQRATGEMTVSFKCHVEWFFADDRHTWDCPQEPIYTHAAAQYFERGTIIWLEQPGTYFVLEKTRLYSADPRKKYSRINDPLEIVQDTSAEVQPPPDLHAPQSGFGLVWRGDVSQSPGYRQVLGWALEPEFGYEAVYQCDSGYLSSGILWQNCYLKRPDGEIVFFHPLGGWQLLNEAP